MLPFEMIRFLSFIFLFIYNLILCDSIFILIGAGGVEI
jgi:hypothetical protein